MSPSKQTIVIALLVVLTSVPLLATKDVRVRRQQPVGGHHYRDYSDIQAVAPCQEAGYSGGCCQMGPTTCYNSLRNCYCDISCHIYGDCCRDIEDIGCPAPDQSTCPDLPALGNGSIIYNPLTHPKRIGTMADYSCLNASFTLVGDTVRICQYDNQWSGTPPTCRPMCPKLSALENGRIVYSIAGSTTISDSASSVPVRTVAEYTCNDGYVLRNPEQLQRICQNSHTWSRSDLHFEPDCRVAKCAIKFANTGGCCHGSSCYIESATNGEDCSCAPDCFEEQECCDDVGCVPSNPCAAAGLSAGCCDWENSATESCYVAGSGGCYCDPGCHEWGDCCSNVTASTTCASKQEITRPASVRIRYGNRNALANRYRAKLARKQAGEFMSMSQEHGERAYGGQDKAHWEKIEQELLDMYKKNHPNN